MEAYIFYDIIQKSLNLLTNIAYMSETIEDRKYAPKRTLFREYSFVYIRL